ncbi:hypothetical protein KV205_13285 [Streptomyces sp. SKN60]|uniref:hypothetical protein n=1 Tax=Streptomyces sp. SKN60 TaxID=2855506 RepID=UPI0022452323|nr:hypothetical protein [Streptomyces sp. SKN60]MCX2181497.1 hypothetical protein [Streptomyces sp. SKN60]
MSLFDTLTGTRRPSPGVAPRSAEEIRRALLGLNGSETAYVVRVGTSGEGADLVAEWRIRELRMRLRTRMRLVPETCEVRALDERWEASTPDAPGMRYSRGAGFKVDRRWTYEKGPDGRRHLVETFRFDSRDMRNALVRAVLDAGWTWRGVVFGKL